MAKSSQAQPGIEIELGGKTRKLCLDLNGLCRLEEYIEAETQRKNVSVIREINWEAFSARDLRRLLWAGLITDEPNLTFEEVGKMFEVFGLIKARLVIAEAIKRAFPEASEQIDSIVDPKKRTKENPSH